MKKLLIAFTLCMYSVPICVFTAVLALEWDGKLAYVPPLLAVVMMLMVCGLVVANIVGALVGMARGTSLSPKIVLVFKLCLIPFYIVNFFCWTVASAVFHIALFVWPLVPLVIAYTYFTMLGTSIHNLVSLLTFRRKGSITTKQFVIHCILQLIFTVDVMDSIYLAAKQKKLQMQ